jgi:hypothetical protein
MSGRIYDQGNYAYCKKCGSDMYTSAERNHWGPMCKNKMCDGGLMDAEYYSDKMIFRYKKLQKILNNYYEKD